MECYIPFVLYLDLFNELTKFEKSGRVMWSADAVSAIEYRNHLEHISTVDKMD